MGAHQHLSPGGELRPALARAVRGHAGQSVAAVLALAVGFEGILVLRKVEAARSVAVWAHAIGDDAALPTKYPRQTTLAPDFSLVDQTGDTVSLSQLRGQPIVVTFVFAHCQTLCPIVVDTLKQASRESGAASVLLVTLDPWRDTPSALPGIASRWGVPGGFHVLSSRRIDDVVRVGAQYGVTSRRDERTGDVVHPGLVFLIDADGRLAYTFSNPSPAWVREGLRRLQRADVLAR